jgi:hypothetical protein
MSELNLHLSREQQRIVAFQGSLLLAEGFVREGFLDLLAVSDANLPSEIAKLIETKFITGACKLLSVNSRPNKEYRLHLCEARELSE